MNILDTKRCMTELINSPNEQFKDIFFDMFEFLKAVCTSKLNFDTQSQLFVKIIGPCV